MAGLPIVRIRIDLAYDGTDFKGWARQPGLRTVQGEVEVALATVLRVPHARVTCAGRTDSGVHARGQVLHIDVDEATLQAAAGRTPGSPVEALGKRLNGILPADVRVRGTQTAPDGFDARFSAIWRRYAYRVTDGPADPLTRNHVLVWPRPLDVAAMNRAAEPLIGLRDFASFCRPRDGATTVRTLLDLHWERTDPGPAVLTVVADAFCHNMVRALVGALLSVGEGKREPQWAADVLEAARRDPAVAVAPAHGLTLEEVGYPDGIELLRQAERARNKRELPDG